MTRLSKIQKTILKVIRYYNKRNKNPISSKKNIVRRVVAYKPLSFGSSYGSVYRSLYNLQDKKLVTIKKYRIKHKSKYFGVSYSNRLGYILTKAGEKKISK